MFDLAEKERKGALLKKFKRVERRSGGLCNPDLLQEAIRNASTDPEYAPMSPSASTGDILSLKHPPRRPSGNLAEMSGLALVGLGDAGTAGFTAVTGTGGGAVNTEDIPWADDLLCMATRKRHAAMLKARGRALAKGLARLLRGVSSDLKEVASRLPPWEETEPEEEEECLAPEVGRVGCSVFREFGGVMRREAFDCGGVVFSYWVGAEKPSFAIPSCCFSRV